MKKQLLGNVLLDFTGSIRDYDFTKHSVLNLNRIITSRQFEDMPSETIFQYLKDEMEIVSFGDYLKRYIYERSGMTDPYRSVPEEVFITYIAESFSMNRAPHAFTPVRTRWSGTIRRWLHSDSVKRSTVFLIGFGLNMTDQDVSEFLTKVLKEQDFQFRDATETVFWYCYHHGYPYSKALELLAYHEGASGSAKSAAVTHANSDDDADHTALNYVPEGNDIAECVSDPGFASGQKTFWDSVNGALTLYLSNQNKIKEYLIYLKNCCKEPQELLFDEFQNLYERAVFSARNIMQIGGELHTESTAYSGAYGIECILCSGMPRTSSGNLTAATKSTLAKQFVKKRMSRQRLSRILRREAPVERFDLITLLFLVFAGADEPDEPEMRYLRYVEEGNRMLERCGLMGLYPVNPYESFVLMCLLTEEPLAVYNDVWELSYEA